MEQTAGAGFLINAHSCPVCPGNLLADRIDGYCPTIHHSTIRGFDPHHKQYPCNRTTKGNEEVPRLVETGTRRSAEPLEESYFAGSLLLP